MIFICIYYSYMKFYFLVFFYENPNPGAIFFVYVKLLISLLNGALFRLGEKFSVRDDPGRRGKIFGGALSPII